MSRILLNTLGSLGDLHPYLAIGVELRRRGHDVRLATHPQYRERAEDMGLDFAPVGTDIAERGDLDDVMRRAMARWSGSHYVLEKLVLAELPRTVDDLLIAAADAELLVSHVISLAAPMVAERLGVPRVHTALQPMTMYSAHDPALVEALPLSSWLARRGPVTWRAIHALMRVVSQSWMGPVAAERRRLGLAPSRRHPLFDPWTPGLNLALFSPVFAAPQPDWPAHTVATGFPFPRGPGHETLPANLEAFLADGEPPLVFTLGSSAVYDAGRFYVDAARAAGALGMRAVLLTGPEGRNPLPPGLLSERIVTCEYAAHAPLFRRAAAIVHQGGIGTTARALASGRPMLVMPWSHDQPDNARRCARLGVARVVPRERWSAPRAAREIATLLETPAHAAAAREVADRLAPEDGARTAADAIERRLAEAAA